MKIAGIHPNSFVDRKGMIAYVVFTRGCNLNCWYCHNRDIISDGEGLYDADKVLDDIEFRKGFIDIVVISGGEPTLQTGLKDFILKVKKSGLKVKLDTNGTNPDIIEDFIKDGLVDFISMDIKAPYEKYDKIAGRQTDINAVKRSVAVLMNSPVDYEFRTTFCPELSREDIIKIAVSIKGARLYALQQFVPSAKIIKKHFGPHSREYIQTTADEASKYVRVCVRGLV